MKPLKIWEPKEEKPPEEPQHFLDLRSVGHSIDLVVVTDANQELASLLSVNTKTRELWLNSGVIATLGFRVDTQGRVRPQG